LAQGVLVGHP
jgi:hypothetical protein